MPGLFEDEPMSRVVAIHPGALGDVLLLGQLLSALRGPGDRVALAARGSTAGLLAELGVVDEALDIAALPLEGLFVVVGGDVQRLAERLGPCDRLVSALGYGDERVESALRALVAPAEAVFLPIRPPAEHRGHIVELWADRLGLDGVPVPDWSATAAMRQAGQAALRSARMSPDKPYIALHLGAGSAAKCWPVERHLQLARRLGPAVLLLGEAERERLGDDAIARLVRDWPVLLDPPLATLAGVLAGAARYVGHDTGPSHLAAALGTPTLALFGPTRPDHFAPRGPRVTLLHHEPLAKLNVEAVATAFVAMSSGVRSSALPLDARSRARAQYGVRRP